MLYFFKSCPQKKRKILKIDWGLNCLMKKVDIVIPVFNNSKDIPWSVENQYKFYEKRLKEYKWNIIIADNASTDETKDIVKNLMQKFKRLKYMYIPKQGRGGAIEYSFLKSKADVLIYMDVDLATKLDALPTMVKLLAKNKADIVTGSRYHAKSKTKRKFSRFVLSKCFNGLLKLVLHVHFTDAQCGFKGMRKEIVKKLLPMIKDKKWFWDTEMLYLAEKNGYRIKEIPITWYEAESSSVKLLPTILEFLAGIFRLKWMR